MLDDLSCVQTFRYFEGGALSLPPPHEVRAANERLLAAVKPLCVKVALGVNGGRG
jgi:hypothetical protein